MGAALLAVSLLLPLLAAYSDDAQAASLDARETVIYDGVLDVRYCMS